MDNFARFEAMMVSAGGMASLQKSNASLKRERLERQRSQTEDKLYDELGRRLEQTIQLSRSMPSRTSSSDALTRR